MSNNPSIPSNLDYGLYEGSGNRVRRGSSTGRNPRASRSPSTGSTHVPESSSPRPSAAASAPPPTAPSQLSVEDFIALPGRENFTRLHPDRLGTDTWFKDSGNRISKSINRMLNGLLQHPYPTYSQMPLQEQEMWFRQFAQEFTWDSHITALVRSEFHKKAAVMYSRKLNEWKASWSRNVVPRELAMNPDLWNGFIAYWSEEATKSSSSVHSACRNSDRKGKGKATHNLGATSLVTKAKQLFRQDGVQPSALRLIEVAHTNKNTKEIQDGVAREIVENVRKMGEEFLQSQPFIDGTPPLDEVPVEKINEFVYECTPKNKGRVFGLPDDSSSYSASSRYFGDPTADLRAELAQNQAEMAEMRATVQRLEEAGETQRAQNQAMMDRMNAFFSQYPPPPPF